MSKGIVYILTNPCLDGWVKIGMTERDEIAARLSELNAPTNIPLSYRAYALYHVEKPYEVERSIHKLIDIIDGDLHARENVNGKLREREFFKVSPETAYSVFVEVAKLRGDSDNLQLVDLTDEQEEEEEVQKRAPRFSFDMIGIKPDAELVFTEDESIRCTVVDNRSIEYDGVKYSLSGLAEKLTGRTGLAGPWFFKYDGEILGVLRQKLVGDYKQQ